MFRKTFLIMFCVLSGIEFGIHAEDLAQDKAADANAQNVNAAAPSTDAAKDKKDPKKRQNVINIAESLRALMQPSPVGEQLKKTDFDVPPSYRIIKSRNDTATLVYSCRFASPKSMVNLIEPMLSSQGVVESSVEQNVITITDKLEKMDELKEALIAIDVNPPQVLVDAKVIEVIASDGVQRNVSVTWNRYDARQNLSSSTGTKTSVPDQNASDANKGISTDWYPVTSGGIGDSSYSNLDTAMQWLLLSDDAKILSAPNLIVSRNATASIVTGSDIPIQTIQVVSGSTTTSTEFKRIGVKLNVTPTQINRSFVKLQVNPQVSNVSKYQTITQNDTDYPVPVIAIRNIETSLTVQDGQVILLGGLYSSRETSSIEKTPVVSDIPWLGDMLSGKNVSNEITQLLFILKVTILTHEKMAEGIIYDPGKQAEEIRKAGNIIQKSNSMFPRKVDSVEDTVRGSISYENSDGSLDTIGGKRKNDLDKQSAEPSQSEQNNK